MEIRKAVSEDIPKIFDNRIRFVSDFSKSELSAELIENTLNYLKENIGRDDFLAWLAFDNDERNPVANRILENSSSFKFLDVFRCRKLFWLDSSFS